MKALATRLNTLVATQDKRARRDADPVSFVHRYEDPADQEVVGLVSALLAFGNVTTIRNKVEVVLAELGPRPAKGIARRGLPNALAGFRHRVWRGEHVAALLKHAAAIRRDHGSLAGPLERALSDGAPFREAVARLADELRGDHADRGLRHLVPDPRKGSACKRLLLYLRWMCRPADGVDLGLWSVAPSHLVIPVDTHVLRIGRNLRLTERTDASWRTAEEITASLRRFDASDPVKYDFAICHLGVSRDCPSRRDNDCCARCVLQPVCRHWS
ncbi:MAG: TIGR02757 family protein [Sandaracinaceae bacterium]